MITPHRPTTWPIFLHQSLDSTSNETRRLVESCQEHPPFVVVARTQTAGRGRGTNSWWSDDESLLFTLAFEAESLGISPHQEPRLALIAALAVIDALPDLTLAIRWPNDVVAGRKKLCGILPEKIDRPGQASIIALGIGINVNTRLDDAPAEIRDHATSIAAFGKATTCEAMLDAFLAAFCEQLNLLACESGDQAARWNMLNALSGDFIRIRQGDAIISGTVEAIEPDGSLRVATSNGPMTLHGGQLIHDR